MSTFSQPTKVNISQLKDYEGKQVIVRGTVTEQHITTYGGHIINIKDINTENNTEAIVYVEEKTNVEYGDKIEALGQVQRYNDQWEIVVSNVNYITIIQKWSDIIFPLWQLAENPQKYIGININISGIIDRNYESYFYLINNENTHSIIVHYNPSKHQNLTEGNNVLVAGQFIYDEEKLRYIIDVKEENHNIFLIRK